MEASHSNWMTSCLGAFLCQGSSLHIRRPSMRVLILTVFLFSLLTFAIFGSLLTSFLSVKRADAPLNTLEEIMASGMRVTVMDGTAFRGFFAQAPRGSLQGEMWRTRMSFPLPPSGDGAMDEFYRRENVAFVTNPKVRFSPTPSTFLV